MGDLVRFYNNVPIERSQAYIQRLRASIDFANNLLNAANLDYLTGRSPKKELDALKQQVVEIRFNIEQLRALLLKKEEL